MKRQHIALTEAQIIAAEKGELHLETRYGEKVVQLLWLKPPYDQKANDVLIAIFKDGETCFYPRAGKRESFHSSNNDLFVSEPSIIEPSEQSPKPLYEVGEIIEMSRNGETWFDVEYFVTSKGFVFGWLIFENENKNGIYHYCNKYHRKKQKPRIYISGRVKNLAYKEAFDLFETAETELIAKGYDVCNPMKEVPYNETWSWFDYLSADIKLMEKCTHIYMLSNWRESGGASVEHEAAKWNDFTIIYQ